MRRLRGWSTALLFVLAAGMGLVGQRAFAVEAEQTEPPLTLRVPAFTAYTLPDPDGAQISPPAALPTGPTPPQRQLVRPVSTPGHVGSP